MTNQKVLILGTNGMTGRSVYDYLGKNYGNNIYGTTRKSSKLRLSFENLENDLAKIIKRIGKIDYVINCIGVNKVLEEQKINAVNINSLLPLKLSYNSGKYKYRLIHISTDAVFSKDSGMVTEEDAPSPENLYETTKLLGESDNKRVLNVRTSLIGFNPGKKTGLLEFVVNNKNSHLEGFTNNAWSGCTTLQFAMFCEDLIYKNKFGELRKKNGLIHFAPLGPFSKHDLISAITSASKQKIKLKSKKTPVTITRYLSSVYLKKDWLNQYNSNIHAALKDLFEYERGMKVEN